LHTTRQILLVVVALLGLAFVPGAGRSAGAAPALDSIQKMINDADDGGTVIVPYVQSGYTESLTIAKNLSLVGAEGGSRPIVRAPAGQRVMMISGGKTVRLRHLTIEGGAPTDGYGGGIKVEGSNITIEDCLVRNNQGEYGGGLFQSGAASNVVVSDSRFENNKTTQHGGGLSLLTGNLSLSGTDFVGNVAGGHGGGVYTLGGSTSITGGTFDGNGAGLNGGGVDIDNAISVIGTRFVNNVAGVDGGGLAQWNAGKTLTLTGAHFENNRSPHQGGGLWTKGNVTITGSKFIGNLADSASMGSDVAGGGVFAAEGTLFVAGSTFERNEAKCVNPCAISAGGGIEASKSSSALVKGSTFTANKAWSGAGISSDAASLSVEDSQFSNNSGGYGAGICATTTHIVRSTFTSNTVINSGGALAIGMNLEVDRTRFVDNRAGASGGAVWASGPLVMTNSLLANNTAGSNSAAALLLGNPVAREISFATMTRGTATTNPAIVMEAGSLNLRDTIVSQHGVGVKLIGGSLAHDYNLYAGNGKNVEVVGGTATDGGHNLTPANPGFVNPAAGDFHLLASSPAVDHGVHVGVRTDLDGDPRPMFGGYDIGMDEMGKRVVLPLVRR
jgi:predicted outer membrane repeat protein